MSGLISDIIACPGMDYCALATARSIPVAQEIATALRRAEAGARDRPAEDQDLGLHQRLRASPCRPYRHPRPRPRGGGELPDHPWRRRHRNRGDRRTRPAPALPMTRSCPPSSASCAPIWPCGPAPTETFLQAYRRVGMEPFKAALYGDGRRAGCRVILPQARRCRPGRGAERPLPAPRGDRGAGTCAEGRRSGPRGAGVVLRGGIGGAAAPGLGHRAGNPGAVHRHPDAVPRNAGLPARAGRKAAPLRRPHHPRRPSRGWRSKTPTARCTSSTPTPAAPCARSNRWSARCRTSTAGSPGASGFRAARRGTVEFFEAEGDLRIKVNPLAHWGREDLEEYMVNNRLPRHPLVAKGYPVHRLRALHQPGEAGRRPARRPLARQRKRPNAASISSTARPCAAPPHRRTRHERASSPTRLCRRRPARRLRRPGRSRRAPRRAVDLANTDDPARAVEPPRRPRADPHRLSGLQRRPRLYHRPAAADAWATPGGCARMAR